jgi:hypothetical protein
MKLPGGLLCFVYAAIACMNLPELRAPPIVSHIGRLRIMHPVAAPCRVIE